MKKVFLVISMLYASVAIAQVNLQSGASEAGFPLFRFTDAKARLETDISLQYTGGSGIRANELAGNVGTGWTLQAAGVISRLQYGEADDQFFTGDPVFKDHIARDIGDVDDYYPDGYMYSTIPTVNPMPNEAAFLPAFPSGVQKFKPNFDDREQDVYAFRFNGKSGEFIIGRNKQPLVLTDSKLSISFEEVDMTAQKIRTKISSFTITDEEGIKYKFEEKEVSDAMKYTWDFSTVVNGFKVYTGHELKSSAIRKIVTKWFLTEIINPFTLEKIIFDYDSYSIDIQGARHLSIQSIPDGGTFYVSKSMLIDRSKVLTQRLASITFPDLHKVVFNYSAADRIDLPGDKTLTEINILYNNSLLYGYRFNYGYLYRAELKAYNFAFPTGEKRYARLCLTDFYKVGADGTAAPSCKFTYHIPTDFSGIVSPMFTLYSDHWGFYNRFMDQVDETDDLSLVYLTGSKTITGEGLFCRNGLLEKIDYPEGGSLQFEYELNRAAASPYLNKQVGGMRVWRTVLYDGISHTNDVIKQYKYINEDGTSSGWGFELPSYTETKTVRQYKFSNDWKVGQYAKDLFVDILPDLIPIALTALGGYTVGSAALTGAYVTLIVYAIFLIYDLFFAPDFKDYTANLTRSDNIKLANPLPIQYSRVEILDEGNANGKIIYEFTNDQFSPLRTPTLAAPYSGGKQRFGSWLYGLPKVITWKNVANQTVRKIENTYNPIIREVTIADFRSRSYMVTTDLAADFDESGIFTGNFINSETFYPIQGRTELTSTKETVYNSTGGTATTETSFTYSPNNFMVRTVSKKDSKGNYVGTTTYYTADYNITGIVNNMKTANMVNIPLSVNNWVKGPLVTDNEKLVGSTVTEFTQITNGDLKPYQVYRSQLTAPLDNTVADVDNFSATNLNSYGYLSPQITMLYTQGNNTQNTVLTGNSSKSSIYDYNQRLVVAEADNALMSEIQYTSFEADGTGGWIFSQNGIVSDYCPTGKKCFDLNKGNIESGLVIYSKPVIISLWTTGSTIQVNKSFLAGPAVHLNPVKTGPVINGWKYCEFELPLEELSATGINISGNGLVDEVRWYPKNARMSTCTYNPGIGITSDCDINNRITYYEYDGLGRLIQIKDQYRNLSKAYEYNYKQ